ncbi:PKD domain-containing protein [Fluviicola sp.]|uniref:PKD domain-containing protein n=1 Tax=Fluviicola sp. TaxID=1917219 RepID=UPI0026124D53|nr:PKD domain-containing protein [Fluviicola sp.]
MNWFFGSGSGLSFSSGNPVPVGGNGMTTNESCASISDANGNKLFYTDGIEVWNAFNSVMPNGSGLLGHKSSQCIIIPKPGNSGKYYIVATDGIEHNCLNGLTYSEVDMSLQGGTGDITAVKNVQLNALNGEWVTAIRHANCVDTWIITHGKDPNNVFLAYHVSTLGINPIPVSTNLGISVPSNLSGVGIMRPNPQGTKIAMARSYSGMGSIELIDFDNASGIATGINNLYTATTTSNSYGLEFSRSGNRLYSGEFGNTYNSIFQYDMTAANITVTRTKVGQLASAPGEIGQLQIAPNDKIYVSYNMWPAVDFIGVITDPELLGTNCGYVENGTSIGAPAMYGLPWYYNPDYLIPSPLELGPDATLCLEGSITLSNNLSNVPGATYLWSDGSTNPTLPVSEAGTYWVQYQMESCLPTIDSITITLDTTQIGHTVGDTSGCTPFTIQLVGIGPPGISEWIWDMGNGTIMHTQNPVYEFKTPGIYTVSLTAISANNCLVQDSVVILAEAFPVPIADFSFQPTVVKPNIPVTFTDQSTGNIASWLWQINDQQISVVPQCSYTLDDYILLSVSLTVTNSDGCSDEKKMTVFKPSDLVYVPNTFTPDGNELNAIFKPIDYFGVVNGFSIYDRWGEQIWSGKSAMDGWDGTIQGKQALPGVYTWVITIANTGIASKEIQGHVTLVR